MTVLQKSRDDSCGHHKAMIDVREEGTGVGTPNTRPVILCCLIGTKLLPTKNVTIPASLFHYADDHCTNNTCCRSAACLYPAWKRNVLLQVVALLSLLPTGPLV